MEKIKVDMKTKQEKAQGLLEFALVTPLLLMLIFGIIEFARLFATYVSVYSASREAARYGAAIGNSESGVPYYRDCQGIKDAAKRVGVIAVDDNSAFDIRYDQGPNTGVWDTLSQCSNSINLDLGDRIRVRITSTFITVVPLVNIPDIQVSAESSRTLIKDVDIRGKVGPTPTYKPENIALPSVTLNKTAYTLTAPEPGGNFTFALSIQNTSTIPVTIDTLTDDYTLSQECLDLIGDTIASGVTVSCTYTGLQTEAGVYKNNAYITVSDTLANVAGDTDSETITITDVLPSVDLTKTVHVQSRPEPGGYFNYTLTIHNTSVEAVTITSLTDSNGLSTECTDLIGTSLAVGAAYSCTYSVTQNETGTYDNTASVTVMDNENNTASDSDAQIVTVTDELPEVNLYKWAIPSTRQEPGGDFYFGIAIKNTSVENVTITSLVDNSNPLPAECTNLIGDVLTPEQIVFCGYSVNHTLVGSYQNLASVTVVDNEGNTAQNGDSETVTVFNALPTIVLTKSVDSQTFNVGDTATYTLSLHNTSQEDVTILSGDDTYETSQECWDAIGKSIPAGGTISCSYPVMHNTAGVFTNTASVIVQDNEGTQASASSSITVTVNALPIEPLVDETPIATIEPH